jgi:hypothetical protein
MAAVTSDIDTLASIYKSQGCRRPGGYTYAELRMGLETFSHFLRPYGIKATLFMVGNDFLRVENHNTIQAMSEEGHEIGNHTMTHAQGFRLLPSDHKEAEISGMERLCSKVTGQRPVGFRSPGWNISDDTLPILKKRGYLYDSSVFPTSLMPLLKFLHWNSTRSCKERDRTTMGLLKYMTAPSVPYLTSRSSLARRGDEKFVEFPITVTPLTRFPFSATFLLATGIGVFKLFYQVLKELNYPIQMQFHLSDFVDYTHPDLAEQVPRKGEGFYVPHALNKPLVDKLKTFKGAMDLVAKNYRFITLAEWAEQLIR